MKSNPFFCEDIVLKSFPLKCERVLDFGCGNGDFSIRLTKKSKQVYACDADSTVIKNNKKKNRNVKFVAISSKGITPYKSNFFDCITMMGVLEHVSDERETLLEMYRILKKGGSLYIYGLNKGLFGFLDSGNIKFRFPYLHRILYEIFYNKKAYQKEFVLKKKHGIFGDVTLGKKWHSHYSKDDLERLLSDKFIIKKHWYYSFALPIYLAIRFVYTSMTKKESKLINYLINQDQKINVGYLSYSFIVKCEKF